VTWQQHEGTASPLGVTWVASDEAYNFSLYSKHATSVDLLLYLKNDVFVPFHAYSLNPLINKSGRVWHCRVSGRIAEQACYYAYKVSGPNEYGRGHRFDEQKILLDPYAKTVHFPEGFSRAVASSPGSDAGHAPLGVIPPKQPAAPPNCARPVHTSDLVIYELHVGAFTAHTNSGVTPDSRGTFLGLVDKIPYLKDLGITAVELMPVMQQDPQEGGCWGYMPLALFAPQISFGSRKLEVDPVAEFKVMVAAFHSAGIEVILDVVYNHTAEGDESGPDYSFRGIDNTTYYLMESDWLHYRNDTGTGNTLNCANRYVRKMIVDSLIFWAHEMHIDGFRFDLASIFTRKEDGTIDLRDPPALADITSAMELAGVRLIAEAWDPVTYQLGRSFPGISWLQWNGRYRDDLRSFVKGDKGTVGPLMTRLYGSADLFPDDVMNAYHAYQSVNYITSHDGFSLYDLVAYNNKRNLANGHDNRDGSDDNRSWNCGWEGDDGLPPDVRALRIRQVKNFCCLLFLSNGTPMFHAGDEFMNTQQGNNNPYNQDNDVTWLNWDLLVRNAEIHDCFRGMIAFRKAHPSLSRSRFWREDISWYGTEGSLDLSPDSHSLAFCLHGGSVEDDDLYVMINGFWGDLKFRIQEGAADEWHLAVDTSRTPTTMDDMFEPVPTLEHMIPARSVSVFVRGNPNVRIS
jgi:isoamylase